jgi:hypothetical protein
VVVALDLDTARNIVNAVSADVSCRGVIEGPDFPAVVTNTLENWHWTGGVRNFALVLAGMGPEDSEFVVALIVVVGLSVRWLTGGARLSDRAARPGGMA